MTNALHSFAEGIGKLGLTETGCAIALLWYFDRQEGIAELRPAFLAELMHDLSLRERIDGTLLGKQMLASRSVIRGRKMGTVRLRRASRSRLSSLYGEISGTNVLPPIDAHVVPAELFEDTRPHLKSLALQINETYHRGLYDACAVMCRRLLKCLLLLAFERAEKDELIRDSGGEYRALSQILGLAASSQHIKLRRGARGVMSRIDHVGELAAHHPTHTTRQKDIDEHLPAYQRVISELVHLAEIGPVNRAG